MPHIFDATGPDGRERLAIRRFLTAPVCGADSGAEFLLTLMEGFPPPPRGVRAGSWWLLNLKRDELQIGNCQDIDLLVGPLDLDTDQEEFAAELQSEIHEWPFGMAPRVVLNRFIARGRVVWPPATETLLLVEAKASGFDEDARQRATITNDPYRDGFRATGRSSGAATQVRGSLSHRSELGFDRVLFLHVVGTRPRRLPGHPDWQIAANDAQIAAERWTSLLSHDHFAGIEHVGYLESFLGAVAHKPEDEAGAGGEDKLLRPVLANPRTDPSAQFRSDLREWLGNVPKPVSAAPLIDRCPACGARFVAPSVVFPIACPCGADPAGRSV